MWRYCWLSTCVKSLSEGCWPFIHSFTIVNFLTLGAILKIITSNKRLSETENRYETNERSIKWNLGTTPSRETPVLQPSGLPPCVGAVQKRNRRQRKKKRKWKKIRMDARSVFPFLKHGNNEKGKKEVKEKLENPKRRKAFSLRPWYMGANFPRWFGGR